MHALVSLFCFLNAVGLCKKREAELCELEEACEVAMAKLAHSPVRVPPARLNALSSLASTCHIFPFNVQYSIQGESNMCFFGGLKAIDYLACHVTTFSRRG